MTRIRSFKAFCLEFAQNFCEINRFEEVIIPGKLNAKFLFGMYYALIDMVRLISLQLSQL